MKSLAKLDALKIQNFVDVIDKYLEQEFNSETFTSFIWQLNYQVSCTTLGTETYQPRSH